MKTNIESALREPFRTGDRRLSASPWGTFTEEYEMAKVKSEGEPEGKKPAKKKDAAAEDENFNFIVRIANSDIDGQKRTVIGLQSIKGVGSRVAQVVVRKATVDPSAKIGSLQEDQVKALEESVLSYVEYAPNWAINRQMDYETGADMHLISQDLTLTQNDDINRMKMIRSYRGIRHETHKKVRGQRTRSNGRRGLTLGVSKKRN